MLLPPFVKSKLKHPPPKRRHSIESLQSLAPLPHPEEKRQTTFSQRLIHNQSVVILSTACSLQLPFLIQTRKGKPRLIHDQSHHSHHLYVNALYASTRNQSVLFEFLTTACSLQLPFLIQTRKSKPRLIHDQSHHARLYVNALDALTRNQSVIFLTTACSLQLPFLIQTRKGKLRLIHNQSNHAHHLYALYASPSSSRNQSVLFLSTACCLQLLSLIQATHFHQCLIHYPHHHRIMMPAL